MADVASSGAPRASVDRLPLPRLLGPWELTHAIGSGAWTTVYRARPAGCAGEGDYAVKVLRPEQQRDPVAIAMLQREAFVASLVSHPHLATVLAAEVDNPPYFLVAPLLAGATLQQSLERNQRLPTPHALWIVRQVAEALRALHIAGWLHRDVNPANVIVSPTGHATLIDLGLSYRLEGADRTTRQMLAGTPAFMAPEVFQASETLTPAVDVYGLGVLLYQLLVGTLPFQDDDPMALVAAHLEAPPPALRQRLPHVPTRVARLVRRMLAKHPLRRPGTEELVATLADLEIETFTERLVA